MKRSLVFAIGITALVLLVAACGGDSEAEVNRNRLQIADEALSFDFDSDAEGFETIVVAQSAQTVENGQYQITSFDGRSNHYLVGSNPEIALKNVMIEVEVERIQGTDNGWYGVVCRTHQNDLGYALLISGDGFWSIARISESVSGLQSLDYLVNWQEHSAINTDGTNTLTAYCVDDYLALYVNDTFVGDQRDDEYDLSGGVGFLAGNIDDESITIAFDNVVIRSAFREGNPNTETPVLPTSTNVPPVEPITTLPPLDSLGGDSSDNTPSEEIAPTSSPE